MNHLQLAKDFVKGTGIGQCDTATEIALVTIAHALIALTEAIQMEKTNSQIEDRIKRLDDFRFHAEQYIEDNENRNPQTCPACKQPKRYDFNSGWNCLNPECDHCLDDVPF